MNKKILSLLALASLLFPILPSPALAVDSWISDVDADGMEDHTDWNIAVPDFTRACQLSPDLWDKANFADNSPLTEQMQDIALRLNTTWNNYQKMCVENDPDGDWLFTKGPYGSSGSAFWGCSYNDPHPNQADATDCRYGFVKIPYSSTPAPAPQPTPTPAPAPSPAPAPTPDPTPAPSPEPTPAPAPAPTPIPRFPTNDPAVPVETYANQQNINFEAFPRLTINSFAGRTTEIYPGANTLENAVNAAQANDKIILRAGTYTVSNFLSINKSLYIGAANGEAVTVNIPAGDNRRGIEIAAEGVVLESFKLNVARTAGIALYNSKNIVIRNLDLTLTGAGHSEGIVAYTSNQGLLLENVKVSNTIIGVSCNSAACANWKLSNVKITNRSSADGSGADCFANESGQNLFLKNVEVTGCTADGIDIKGSNVFILNPYVHSVSRNGIKLWNGGDIINALVVDTGADVSIYLGDRGYARLINSTIALPSHNGRAYVLASGYNETNSNLKLEIINTIIYQNGANNGAVLYMPNINNTTRTLSIKNSLFYITSGSVEMEANTRPYFMATDSSNLINFKPAFVNPTTIGDYHLRARSPALNRGQNTVYNFDRAGKTRPANAFDLGAYEK